VTGRSLLSHDALNSRADFAERPLTQRLSEIHGSRRAQAAKQSAAAVEAQTVAAVAEGVSHRGDKPNPGRMTMYLEGVIVGRSLSASRPS